MAVHLFIVLFALTTAGLSEPAPGRIPRVYNALITSNQNLEPSKAYPVYQPVFHDAFAYPYQPVFYGNDFPLTNSLLPPVATAHKTPKSAQPDQSPSETPKESPSEPTPEVSPAPEETGKAGSEPSATAAPPQPPKTESPIPLNQFGLPPQVLPLGRIDPNYNGFSQVGPFTYQYPNVRFYDPYEPFNFNPYLNLPPPPLYRPLPNFISQGIGPQGAPAVPSKDGDVPSAPADPSSPIPDPVPSAPAADAEQSSAASNQTPPPEPEGLNVLNYSSKDPSIPNVPPPPLPEGGLKSDKSE